MSGNILIVDGLATNRIVLKVKLSAAYFRVRQAASGAEALARIREERPQVVLLADGLPDARTLGLIAQIRALPEGQRLPILVLSTATDKDMRLALLKAGAQDVIEKPFNEKVLLARLRALSRQSADAADLDLQSGMADALGFAEDQTGFFTRGHIAALCAPDARLQALWRLIGQTGPHRFDTFQTSRTGGLTGLTGTPDAMLIALPGDAGQVDLSTLAELSSAPQTRDARRLVLLDAPDSTLAATVLDVGAHDIASTHADPAEITLRLNALVRDKQAEDTRKARLRTGLHAAVTDPLTGVYNRRYALAQLSRLARAGYDSANSFAVLVVDIDHFKQVNDTYGHAAGDRVLTKVAHTLRDALRPGDTLSRIGGEEFLIVMPNMGKRDVHKTAQNLCSAVRGVRLALPGIDRPLSLTVSIGATLADPVARRTIPMPDTLLAEADRALYAAKAGGRDTVTVSRLSAA